MSQQQHFIAVGGLTGSGKTTLGKYLARRLGYAYLDKDTITRNLVDALLMRAGSPVGSGDRDSDIYRTLVRPLEYACFLNTVEENIALGVPTIASAPFLTEMTDPDWLENMVQLCEDAQPRSLTPVFIWLDCPVAMTRIRLGQRNAERDQIKLAIWNEYEAFASQITPPGPPVMVFENTQEQSLATLCDRIIAHLGAQT